MLRIVLGILLAPLVVPAAVLAYAHVVGTPRTAAFITTAVVALYVYSATIVGGIPVAIAYRHMRWTHAWQFALTGFAMAVLLHVVAGALSMRDTPFFGLLGLVTATAFWCIGVWRNPTFVLPDRDLVPLAPSR